MKQLVFLPSSVNPRAAAVSEAADEAEGGENRGLHHRRPRGGRVQVARQGRDEDGRLKRDVPHMISNLRNNCKCTLCTTSCLLHPFIHSRNNNIHLGHN